MHFYTTLNVLYKLIFKITERQAETFDCIDLY